MFENGAALFAQYISTARQVPLDDTITSRMEWRYPGRRRSLDDTGHRGCQCTPGELKGKTLATIRPLAGNLLDHLTAAQLKMLCRPPGMALNRGTFSVLRLIGAVKCPFLAKIPLTSLALRQRLKVLVGKAR